MLIIIFGLPGTGKSTFAQHLAHKRSVSHLNTDVIRSQAGLRGQYEPAVKAKVYQLLFEATEALLQKKEDVVLDGTFYTKAIRTPYENLARQYGQSIAWIQMTAAEAVIRERVSKKRAFSEADFEVYKKVKTDFEPLKGPVLTLATDQLTVEQMIKQVAEFIDSHTSSS